MKHKLLTLVVVAAAAAAAAGLHRIIKPVPS